MIALKQVLHDPDTNSIEATWVTRTSTPDTIDESGNVVPGIVTDVQVKCHSYSDVQMDMLESDLGSDLIEHSALIATVRFEEINRRPPPPTAQELADSFALQKAAQFAEFNNERTKYLDALTGIAGRAARFGDTATATICDGVADGLLVLKDQPEVLAATDLPGLQQAMLYCYAKLLVNVPANVASVFAKVKS